MRQAQRTKSLGAQTSALRESAQARRKLDDLQNCLLRHEESYWQIGDTLISLVGRRDNRGNRIGGMGYTLTELAERLGYKPARMCQIYRTALAFPEGKRSQASFYDHELARKAARTFPQIVSDLTATVRELAKAKVVDSKTGKARAIRTIRDLSQYYAQRRAQHETAATVRGASLSLARTGTVIDQCFNLRFEELMPVLVAAKIRFNLIFADPPYQYPNGNVYRGTSVARMESDCFTPQEAMATTLQLLRTTNSLLAPSGCLLLCQAAGPLRLEFQQALLDYNLAVRFELIWNKGSPKPGAFDEPYSIATERIWVICRQGDRLKNHDLSGRSEILTERPVEHDASDPHATHAFEKPPGLCRRLLGKHTYEGAVILEPYGCSGAMSVAAIQMGRHFVYCESHPRNFSWGAGRIQAAMRTARQRAG